MRITRRQIRKLIREWFSDEHNPTTGFRDGATYAADIEEPAQQANEIGMSFEEYIQLYIDAANKAGVKIMQNTPDVFTVQGPADAVIEYGFQINQAEGGPSFNEEEFAEYAMYEV